MRDDLHGVVMPPVHGIEPGSAGAKPVDWTLSLLAVPPTSEARPTPVATEPGTIPGPRKIGPDLPIIQPVFVPSGGAPAAAASGFLERLLGFFGLGGGAVPEQPRLVSFAQDPRAPATEKQPHDLPTAVERFERAQEFSVGVALASSLTQSVMSSSRRLTQGQ